MAPFSAPLLAPFSTFIARIAVLALGLSALASARGDMVTPVQKVIKLMEGMIQKGADEKNADAEQFSAYKAFCDSTTADKQKPIKDANDKIEMPQADIAKFQTDVAALGAEVAQLGEDISTWQKDPQAATKVRDIENNDYTATHADYSSWIEALETASKRRGTRTTTCPRPAPRSPR